MFPLLYVKGKWFYVYQIVGVTLKIQSIENNRKKYVNLKPFYDFMDLYTNI